MKLLITIACMCLPLGVMANMRHYKASIEDSNWQVTQYTRLKCELNHNIPGYGQAQFYTEASKQLNLEFVLDMLRLPNNYDVATIYSVPPSWMPGVMRKTIGQMDIRRQYDGDVPQVPAWEMLTELEKGFWPTIYYQDWNNRHDKVAVSLNASNFKPVYNEFAECVSQLLPYSFDDIAYTVLSYKKNSSQLTKYAQKRLDMIGEYLKEDPDLELVLLDGYTDSWGGSWLNEQLSLRRASEIKDFFASQGVDDSRIEITGHGEKRHISPNDNEIDRSKNRRVVIRLSKP